MKTRLLSARLLSALVGLAISFALPTIAQEKEEVNPKILAGIQAKTTSPRAASSSFGSRAFGRTGVR
jgi:hypothetical protein